MEDVNVNTEPTVCVSHRSTGDSSVMIVKPHRQHGAFTSTALNALINPIKKLALNARA